MLFGASAALAAEPMAPNDIKTTFFTGQPFTAASPSGAKFKMTFTPNGKMTREPLLATLSFAKYKCDSLEILGVFCCSSKRETDVKAQAFF